MTPETDKRCPECGELTEHLDRSTGVPLWCNACFAESCRGLPSPDEIQKIDSVQVRPGESTRDAVLRTFREITA